MVTHTHTHTHTYTHTYTHDNYSNPRCAHEPLNLITHIYIEDMRTSNFVPTLHGFRWYPFFCGSGTVSGVRGKQMTLAVASNKRSVSSKNHDYNVYITSKRIFRVAVNTYVYTCISGSRCTWWQKTTNRRTHTHTGQPQ